jgi:hypothetical protein
MIHFIRCLGNWYFGKNLVMVVGSWHNNSNLLDQIQNMAIHFYQLVLFDVYFIEDKMKYDLFLLSPSDKTTPQNSPFLFWIMYVLHLVEKG